MGFSTVAGVHLRGRRAAAIPLTSSDESACTVPVLGTYQICLRPSTTLTRPKAPLIGSLSLSAFNLQQPPSAEDPSAPAKLLLASFSSSVAFSKTDHRLREAFDEIDVHRKGVITQADLNVFATRNGLPSCYVPYFLSAIRRTSDSSATTAGADDRVDYDAFRTFVAAREEGLRKAFDVLDRDRDGKISEEDVLVGLAHARITCPYSRCTYQCRRASVEKMLSGYKPRGRGRQGEVDFQGFRRFFIMLPEDDLLVHYWMSARCVGKCDIGNGVLIRDCKDGTRRKDAPWGHLLAGAAAGATSRTATAPLETLRLSAMTGATATGTPTMTALMQISQKQGWRALYRGNLTNVLRSAPQKALDFFAFDMFKGVLSRRSKGGKESIGTGHTLVAAGLAGASSNLVLYPLEVVRCRLSVDQAGMYRGIADATTKILQKEGLGGLYKGVVPSVAAILPEAAITYGLFDILRRAYMKVTKQRDVGVVPSLTFGVSAAFSGQLVAYPLETISRRMQVSPAMANVGMATAVKLILQEGGVPALYRGIWAASLRVIPMAMVSFSTYELVRMAVHRVEEELERQQEIRECNELHCNEPCLLQAA